MQRVEVGFRLPLPRNSLGLGVEGSTLGLVSLAPDLSPVLAAALGYAATCPTVPLRGTPRTTTTMIGA